MEIIIHRVNKIKKLKELPINFGCEVDIRVYNDMLILNHEPYSNGDSLENFLRFYNHGTLILNIKESGIENDVIELLIKFNIKSWFLLDVEFPFIYQAVRKGIKNIAVRFSEDEPIEFCQNFINRTSWVWIDTNTMLPVNLKNIPILNNFKKCLVCPERWGRPNDIPIYKRVMKEKGFEVDAIMTSFECAKFWIDEI